jgi:hypothetical protein
MDAFLAFMLGFLTVVVILIIFYSFARTNTTVRNFYRSSLCSV